MEAAAKENGLNSVTLHKPWHEFRIVKRAKWSTYFYLFFVKHVATSLVVQFVAMPSRPEA